MAVRKEQVLAVLVLGIGILVGRHYLAEPDAVSRLNLKKQPYDAKEVTAAELVTTGPVAMVRRDFCTEPSETQPLPPRPLEFPPRSPLSLAALPLDHGPDYRHAYSLRVDGAPLAGVTIAMSGAPAPADASAATPDDGAAGQGGRAAQEARAARNYDRLWVVGQSSPFFGTLEADGKDLFALEERPDFTGLQLRLRIYEIGTQRLREVRTFGDELQKIDHIVLAGTLRNEVTRHERKVPENVSYLPERRDLINWLLEVARESSWVYDKALEHAKLYRQLQPSDLEGLRLMQRVMRARGDLAGELAMLEGLPATGAEGAFKFESLGLMKGRLGLWLDAEADLRQAIALQPTDARPHAALAEVLRLRGRAREALAMAKKAEQTASGVQDPADKTRVGRVIVSCHLAVGDVASARAALPLAQASGPQPYLEGCVHYAAGDIPAALAAFRTPGAAIDSGASQFGQAACLAWQGSVQEAHDLLLRVYDQEPMLRHRSATGLAWLFLRVGQYESAIGWIDRALEADPQDVFAFYLRGRTLRLSGQLDAAAEALAAALRLRDDFVHAIAEMAEVQAALAFDRRGDVNAAVAARRYADRAVELAPSPAQELFELQGLHAFDAADPVAAKEAFTRSRDLASDDKLKWYGKGAIAVVDYSRGLVDEAEATLRRIIQDLVPKDDPMVKWAQARLHDIDDHAQKEALGDGFDRSEPGAIWFVDVDGLLAPEQPLKGRLHFRGKFSKSGKGDVSAERVGAVRKGKNFLAVGITVAAGSKQPSNIGFFGLALVIPRGSGGAVEFRARLGIREGKPYVRVEDGREEGNDNIDQKQLAVEGFDFTKPQELELRVVPSGDEQAKKFELRASWNGNVVYRRELKTLTGNTNTELKTVLFVGGGEGKTNDEVDVSFTDYRLQRRKDL